MVLYYYMIVRKALKKVNSRHVFIQSEVNPTQIVTRSLTFFPRFASATYHSEWVQWFRLYDTQFETFHYLSASLGAIGYNETRMDYSAYEIDIDHILPTLLWGSFLRRGWKTVTFPVGRIRWATWRQAQGHLFDFAPALTSHSGVLQRVSEPLRRGGEILRWSALSSRRSYHKANLCYSVFIQTFQATLYHVSLAKVKLNPGNKKTLSWWRENVKKTGCSRFCNILYWIT